MLENPEQQYKFSHEKAKASMSESGINAAIEFKQKVKSALSDRFANLADFAKKTGENIFYQKNEFKDVPPISGPLQKKYGDDIAKELACVALAAETAYEQLVNDKNLQQKLNIDSRTEYDVFSIILSNLIYGVIEGSYHSLDDEHLDNLTGAAQELFDAEF